MLRIDLEKNSFSRTKKINKIMFVVVPIMNSEPFIKVGHRISESSRIPKFSDISKSCKQHNELLYEFYSCIKNTTAYCNVSRIHTRIRFYQNWPRDYGLLSPPILFIRRFDFLLLLQQLLGWGILFLYKKLQKYIKEKYFS